METMMQKNAFEAAFAGSGRRVILLPETGSTNSDLRRMAESGAPSGTVLVAGRQSGGRGRLGRSFSSPDGGLYMSLLLRPDLPPRDLAGLTGAAAVAAAEILEEESGLPVGIKWVNDLIVGGKKIAGILCEASLTPEGNAGFVIVGIGLNLEGTLPAELSDIATTVAEQGGRVPDPGIFARRFAEAMEALAADPFSPRVIAESRRRSVLIGCDVNVIRGDSVTPARVLSITDRGELSVVYRDGRREDLSCGEVSVRRVVD